MIPQPGTPPKIGVGCLANNININDESGFVTCISAGAFGYHCSFITTKSDFMYSSVISSANDACVKTTCSFAPQICHLSLAQLQLERKTMVTSHEFAEMLTNPHANAWFDDSDPSQQGDVADICRTNTDPTSIRTITVGPNTWTIQKIYSVTDALAGRDPGVTSAPNPLPQATAPVPWRIPLAHIHQLHKMAHVLPLPDIYYDAAQNKAVRDEQDIVAFLRRLVYPYRPKDFATDPPAFARYR